MVIVIVIESETFTCDDKTERQNYPWVDLAWGHTYGTDELQVEWCLTSTTTTYATTTTTTSWTAAVKNLLKTW